MPVSKTLLVLLVSWSADTKREIGRAGVRLYKGSSQMSQFRCVRLGGILFHIPVPSMHVSNSGDLLPALHLKASGPMSDQQRSHVSKKGSDALPIAWKCANLHCTGQDQVRF